MKKRFLFMSIILLAFSSNLFAQNAPTNPAVLNITTTSVDLTWTDNGCAPLGPNFTVHYRILNSGGSWTNAGTAFLPNDPLTGLTSSTTYEWRVKCTGGTGPTSWTPLDTFTTLCSGVFGCVDITACNYDALATCDDGSCLLPDGCTDPIMFNYDPFATCDDGSCVPIILGCTDPVALNFYDATANTDDGSCVYVAPTISSAFISNPILCNGIYDADSIQVNVAQAAPIVTYSCLIGYYSGTFFIAFSNTAQTDGTQLNFNNFNPNVDYFVRIVDSLSYYNSNAFGNGTSTVGVYDETGPINFAEPTQLTATLISTGFTCVGSNDGTATVTASGGTPFTAGDAYTYNWLDNAGGSIGQTTALATGLALGDYSCTVTDSNGCVLTTSPVTIQDAPSLTATGAGLDVSCFGYSDGTATVTVSGGTPFTTGDAYAYEWFDDAGLPIGQTTNPATGLLLGDYSCTVTDSNSCVLSNISVSISGPSVITATTTHTNVLCYGGSDGTATVTASGGTPFTTGSAYTYDWRDDAGLSIGQTTNPATGLSAGIYTCVVGDANGCILETNSILIEQPLSSITATTTHTNVLCYGGNDGTATVTASGGTPFTTGSPYTYNWVDNAGVSIGQTTQTATGLSEGIYKCEVFDASGSQCPITTDGDTIIEPAELVIDTIMVNSITCFEECDASILSIQASGGTPFMVGYSYLYSVNGGQPHPNTSYFNGYCADTYTVEVRDVNNCFASTYLIIDEPNALDVAITTSLWNNYQIRCHGDNSGFADIDVSGGTPPYIRNYYELGNTNPIPAAATVSGLNAGIYTFEVIDDHGCDYSETIIYNEPDTIVHNFIPTHVTCSSWSNGSLIDSVYGGVGSPASYIYSWSTGQNTYSLTGIPTGTYIMTVTDENNCVNTDSYIINDNNALSASTSSSNVSCYNYCDGEISVNATGGIPNINSNGDSTYNYLWNDTLFQTTQTAIGLCVDNNSLSTIYECVVTDMQGCSITLSETITQHAELAVTASVISEISCFNGSDGGLNASVTGGSSPYQYMWSNNAPTYSATSNNNAVPEGDYVITVMDNEGCTAADFITLNEPAELSLGISSTSVTCFGFSDGIIVADADGGTPFLGIPPEYLYTITNEMGEAVYSETIAIGRAENLSPGIYIIVAEDMNGCTIESGTIYISEPGDSLSITFNIVDASCLEANGSVSIDVDGGTPVYQYNWDNGTTTILDSNLTSGYYPVTVIDSRGCEIRDSAFVKGTHNVFADSLAEITYNICLGDSVFIIINETPFNTYIWENGSTITDRWVYPNDYINIYTLTITDPTCPSSYEVVATVNVDFIDPMIGSSPGVDYGNFPVVLSGNNIDLYSENNNCVEYIWQWTNDTILNNNGSIVVTDLQKTDWYYLYVKDSEGCLGYDSIYVVVGVLPHEAITPNNDGFNDVWTPLDIESYANALVQVFNRWGGLVFESKGGENYQAWDGTNSGKELAVGTYYYIIDLNTGDEPQTGPITIIR